MEEMRFLIQSRVSRLIEKGASIQLTSLKNLFDSRDIVLVVSNGCNDRFFE